MTMFDPATSWFEVIEIPNKRAITCAYLVEHTWLCCYPRPLQCILRMDQNSWGPSLQTFWTVMESNVFLQQLGNLLRVHEPEEYEFPCGDPWRNIFASAFHTMLGATPGQLVYGQDMVI
jgi:hypothetical protein